MGIHDGSELSQQYTDFILLQPFYSSSLSPRSSPHSSPHSYQSKLTVSSAKGLKAAGNLTVTGGSLTLDTADDAIHADNYAWLVGGTFVISTGDDVAHANTSLIVGGASGADVSITVNACYEGLEAGTVYIYSGTIKITASGV